MFKQYRAGPLSALLTPLRDGSAPEHRLVKLARRDVPQRIGWAELSGIGRRRVEDSWLRARALVGPFCYGIS